MYNARSSYVSALFHENLLVLHSTSIRRESLIRNSFGQAAVPWISGRDAAELGVAALLHPERFGAPVTYPKGSELFSHADIAGLLTELLDRPVGFEPVGKDEWRQELTGLALDGTSGVVNTAMAQHISSIGHGLSQAGPTLPADPGELRRLMGREPSALREFLQANLEEFEPSALRTS